ncbi:hypothetical protein [Halomonas colorata]|uniref:hypothetical protein n=1 Tax=Halomonas colorata TaxID=2742615 RepID=UPI001866C4E2|nr:hypothetical protein [Halomonas colorata]
MPLSNVERQVLEHVCREGKKCRGGVPTAMVIRLMAPYASVATVGALHALKSEELLSVTGASEHNRGWMATTKGHAELALDPADLDPIHHDAVEALPTDFVSHGGDVVLSDEVIERLSVAPARCFDLTHRVFSQDEIAKGYHVPTRQFFNLSISTDLLDRCAAMNATLLAQAEKAHAAGDTDAWRDLAWLIETGKQLVAVGGEA